MLAYPMLRFPNHLSGIQHSILSISRCPWIHISMWLHTFCERFFFTSPVERGNLYCLFGEQQPKHVRNAFVQCAQGRTPPLLGSVSCKHVAAKTGVAFFRTHRQKIVPLTSSVCVFASEICCLHRAFLGGSAGLALGVGWRRAIHALCAAS